MMRTRLLFAIALLAVGCTAALLLAAAPATRSAHVRWEYKFVLSSLGNPEAVSFKDEPNPRALGEDGWELVAVTPNGNDHLWLSFKRPKVIETAE